jgi:phage replication O-like protein O
MRIFNSSGVHEGNTMAMSSHRFVALPSGMLDALVVIPLTGAQWRVLLWVIRQTLGWNREWTAFTWYRMAKDLHMDRAATYRAGQALLSWNILSPREKLLGIQSNIRQWEQPAVLAGRQLLLPEMGVAYEQRKPLPGDNAAVVGGQRKRCVATTVFRRAKDSSKDKLKTYIDMAQEKPQPAGPFQPATGKYDRLSKN